MPEKVKVIDIAQRSIKQTDPYSYMLLACKSDSFRQCLFWQTSCEKYSNIIAGSTVDRMVSFRKEVLRI